MRKTSTLVPRSFRMHMSEQTSWATSAFDAEAVWGNRPAIFVQIADAVARLDGPDAALPVMVFGDEVDTESLAAVGAPTVAVDNDRLRAKQIAKALRDLLVDATPANLRHLTRLLTRAPVLGVLDDVLADLVHSSAGDLEPDRFHDLAMFLIRSAPDSEVVKLGIGMLGVLVGCDERETLLTVGRHEAFTLFAAVALGSALEAPGEALWLLARGVRGWGRIHAVERLADSQDPRVQAWLLREGFKNDVMDEYLAHVCAVTGDLASALAADIIDDALLDGAAGILGGLLNAAPTGSIEDYADAPRASAAYLRHLVRRVEGRGQPVDLRHLLVVEQLREFISPVGDELEEDDTLRELGWNVEVRRQVLDACAVVSDRPEWADQVLAGLGEDDPERFYQADAAAQLLGLDSWPHHLRRVEAEPTSPHSSASWYRLLQTEDRARFERAVALAEARLPLADIATGPAQESGIGAEFDVHDTLTVIVDALIDRPGSGVALIRAALRSPVTRVRRGAVHVLSAWDERADLVAELLSDVAADEPDEDLAADIAKLLG